MKMQNEGLAYTENTYLNKSGNTPDPSGKGRRKRTPIWLKVLALVLLVAMVIGVVWAYNAIKNFNSTKVIYCKNCLKGFHWGDFNYIYVEEHGICHDCRSWLRP